MSENVAKTLSEASERLEAVERGDRISALAAAIIAVLAALGTLFSHHASITALTAKSQAILMQARAVDQRSSSEAKQIRSELYAALLKADIARTPDARASLARVVDRERSAADTSAAKADRFEEQSLEDDTRSGQSMKAYETLEWATALFEMAIVLVSISTLSRNRALLVLGTGISMWGVVMFAIGLLQGRH